jgi:hypothetical protein
LGCPVQNPGYESQYSESRRGEASRAKNVALTSPKGLGLVSLLIYSLYPVVNLVSILRIVPDSSVAPPPGATNVSQQQVSRLGRGVSLSTGERRAQPAEDHSIGEGLDRSLIVSEDETGARLRNVPAASE